MAEKDQLLEHNYDGIEEYNNDLPRWWLALFGVTIVFGLIRVGYYHFGSGMLQEDRLKAQMHELENTRQAAAIAVAAVSEPNLAAVAGDANLAAKGQAVFAARCLACHGPQGQGLVGPNLADDYWIHGGKPVEIKEIIENGVIEKGMLAWKGTLSDEEINQVLAFVWSLHGTNPPNPKQPEGRLVEQ